MPDDDLPPDPPPPSPHLSGEVTTSARGRPRSVSSLLNEPPDLDAGELHSLEDGVVVNEVTGSGAVDRPYVSTFAPPSDLAADSDDDDVDLHKKDDGSLAPGERAFGDYELLRRLAFGGMGEVFLARRRSDVGVDLGVGGLTRLIVVKRVLAHMRRDEKHRRMFLDEAALQKVLRSPHIVQIHDVGDHDGLVFLAMEHVHGPSWRGLVDRCRKRRQHIPVAFVAEMMIQACEALSYAHNLFDDESGMPLRVVHRDINPHNVLVTYDGVVKLIDFGIAKSELRDQQTETGTIKGKFAYMSPEQSAAEPLDGRSDLFALGICLYELLTLTNPFKRSNIVLSLEAIQKTTPKSVAEVRPGAAILAPIVERMLRKNPDDRFFDCADVATALRALTVDGLLPEPKQTLSSWLRELYADEIAEHHRVLEASREREIDEAPTVPTKTQPSATQAPPPTPPSDKPSRVPRVPTPPPQLVAKPVLPDVGGTNPTANVAAHTRAPLTATTAAPRSRAAIIGVVGLLGIVAAIAVAVGVGPTSTAIVDAGVVRPVVDAGGVAVASPVIPVVPALADAGVVGRDLVGSDAGVAVVVADAGSDVEPVVDPVKPKSPKAPTPPKAVVVVGKVAVSAEGFVVKGGRAVPADGASVLTIDDGDAPFRLKLRVEGDASAGRLGLESTPWAVVRVDQVGRGKTPLRDVALIAGRKTLISLQNPSGEKMDLQVTYTPSR